MSEPTLYLRLRNTYGVSIGQDGPIATLTIPVTPLATIQKQIEDAATAPLRTENAALRTDALGVKTILESNDHLRAELDRVKQAAVSLSETCDGWADSYKALKARADAMYGEIKRQFCSPGPFDWNRLDAVADAYDAADRAGEDGDDHEGPLRLVIRTTSTDSWEIESNIGGDVEIMGVPHDVIPDRTNKYNGIPVRPRAGEETPMPAQVDARDSVASDLVAYVEAMIEDEDGAITEEDRTKIGDMTLQYHALGLSVVPSPTDVDAQGDPNLALAHAIEDAYTNASDDELLILDRLGLGLAEHRWYEARQDPNLQARPDRERINDLVTRVDAAYSRLDMHMQRMDDFQHWREGVDLRLDSLHGPTIDRRLRSLEAARTPVTEVPQSFASLILGFVGSEQWRYVENWDEVSVRQVLDALSDAALAAGGAK